MTTFNPLNVPTAWQQYYTKYPEGYTLVEALLNWVQQVNDMVDNQNSLNTTWQEWETTNNKTIADFLAEYDTDLQDTLEKTLTEWQASGFLNDIINTALQVEIDDVQAGLSYKVNQTDFNTAIANLGNGSPKGTYSNLAALQTAFPAGTAGIYITLDSGHWYYWNGSSWQDGGVYQSTSLAAGSVTEDKIASSFIGKSYAKMSNVNTIADRTVQSKTQIVLPYKTSKTEIASLILQGNDVPQSVLTINSQNIFDVNTMFNGGTASITGTNPRFQVVNPDSFLVLSDGTGSGADVVVTYALPDIHLKPNTSYALSSVNTVKDNYGTKSYIGNWTIIGDGVLLMSGSTNNQKVFTTGASGIISLKLNIQNAMQPVGTTQQITVSNMILAEASAIPNYNRYRVYTEMVPAFNGEYRTALNITQFDTISVSNPVTTAYYETYSDSAVVKTPKTLVSFGDSITGTFVGTDRDYPLAIANKTGLKVYNVGFGGTRMGQHPTPNYNAYCMYKLADAITTGDYTLQNADTSGSPEYPANLATLKSIDFTKVDYVTIAFGTNDWGGGNTPNPPTDNPNNLYDVTNYYGATRYVIKTLLNKYPQLKILLVSPYYRFDTTTGTDSDDGWRPQYNTTHSLTEYVDALLNVAKENKIPALDMYRTLGINKYNRGYYFGSTDGVHPLATGMDLIACRIAGQLNALYFAS